MPTNKVTVTATETGGFAITCHHRNVGPCSSTIVDGLPVGPSAPCRTRGHCHWRGVRYSRRDADRVALVHLGAEHAQPSPEDEAAVRALDAAALRANTGVG